MNLHLFGANSIKSKNDLQKVNIPTSAQESKEDDIWSTGEQDALHIPILGSHLAEEPLENDLSPDLLNPFGVYIAESSIEIIPTLCKESMPAQQESKGRVGIYAPSQSYVNSLKQELSHLTDAPLVCLDGSMTETQMKSLGAISMWIVNLSDEDESPLLDQVLDASTECPTLYLSGSLSKHCKNKIWDFVHENQENEIEVLHS